MSSCSSNSLAASAKELLRNLFSDEEFVDDLLAKAVYLGKSGSRMKDYQIILKSLQESNDQEEKVPHLVTSEMNYLIEENKRLRVALEDHEFTLELIMSKYRQRFCNLLNIRQLNRQANPKYSCPLDLITKLHSQINQMAEIMMKTCRLEENTKDNLDELKAQLAYENKCLKELIKAATM